MPRDGRRRRTLKRVAGWPVALTLSALAAAHAQSQPLPDFGWAGAYVGLGYDPYGLAADPDLFIFTARAGANRLAGPLLLGIEVNAAAGLPGPRFSLDLAARAGFVFGHRNRALYYVETGLAWLGGGPAWIAAFGHEFAVSPTVTVMGELRALTVFGGARGYAVELGVNWHPGN